MDKGGLIALVVLVASVGCVSSPRLPDNRVCRTWTSCSSEQTIEPWTALFVADSQLHNTTGAFIRTQSGIADLRVAVAVRPSELNVLGPLVLRDALSKFAQHVESTAYPAAFYLGDALNVACGGEARVFEESMRAGLGQVPWFMAHGNHDSFLSGMFNDYVPHLKSVGDVRLSRVVAEINTHGLRNPRDGRLQRFYELSWWSAATGRALAYNGKPATGWPGICAASVGEDAVAMNKISWLAWYLASQERQGVTFSHLGSAGDERWIQGGGRVGSVSTRIVGKLHPPLQVPESRSYNVTRAWRSFIVQVVERVAGAGTLAVVLIDTSVGENIGSGSDIMKTVGSIGHVGNEQLGILASELEELRRLGSRVVVGGHHPLSEIEESDMLGELFREKGVEHYFSAHTHAPSSTRTVQRSCVVEHNIGSTTDWPMEAVVARFDGVEVGLRIVVAGADCSMRYESEGDEVSLTRYQACAHAPVAERIANVSEAELGELVSGSSVWRTPAHGSSCSLRQAAKSLADSSATIARRFQSSRAYQDFVLCLAVKASGTECGDGHDATCDSRVGSVSK